jgi:RNA polymerase sigma-B factor
MNRVPRAKEIADFMGITEDTVLEVIEAGNNNMLKSLDQAISPENESELGETLGYEEKIYEKIENRDFLIKTLSRFNEAEKDFITLRYMKNMTQKQIADKFGVSQMYISRLEKRILEKFRSNFA